MTDFTTLPEGLEPPIDDGGASHLPGRRLPPVSLASTAGGRIDLSTVRGLVVVYAYPMTGRPGAPLPGGWNEIPGARGCTPQACSFRDHWAELRDLGVAAVFGVSTQTAAYQREAAQRLHLPFPLLSDADLAFQEMLELPTFEADGDVLLKRLTMIVRDGEIEAALYPVFPPDRSAADVMDRLRRRPGAASRSRH